MKYFLVNNCMKTLMVACSLFLLSACATTANTETLIEERAMARWNAIFIDDLTAAYGYLSPGYRSSVSLSQYQRKIITQRVAWTGADYIESDCTEITCNVQINLEYALYGVIPGVKKFDGSQKITESWIKVSGKWYLVPEE
jgi:hypothetical protein